MAVSTRGNGGGREGWGSRNDHGLNIGSGQQRIQVFPGAGVVGVDVNPTRSYTTNQNLSPDIKSLSAIK